VLNVIPARTHRTAGVQSGPKSSGVECRTWKGCGPGPRRSWSPQPQGRAAGAALGWPKKPRPVCNEPDMPTSVWPGKARKVCGTPSTWELQSTSDTRRLVHPKPLPTGARRRRPQPGIAKWSEGNTMRFVRHRFPSGCGSGARKGLALEGFEPCEAKVSRTVLRGAWAG
jgi:hypothetical protein